MQGVGLRWFAKSTAERLGLTGWVENKEDGRVIVEIQGIRAQVQLFCEIIREGRAYISVEQMTQRQLPLEQENGFQIH